MTGLDRANNYIQHANAILAPRAAGSDFSDLIEKLKGWVEDIDLVGIGREGAHALLHFVLDVMITKVIEVAPTYVDLLVLSIVVPFLKKIDAEFFHPEVT